MTVPLRALLIGQAEETATWLISALREAGYSATVARRQGDAECRSALAEDTWDVVLYDLGGSQATPALSASALEEHSAQRVVPVVVLADDFESAAPVALRLGAALCLRQAGLSHLGPVMEHACRASASASARRQAEAFEHGQRQVLELMAQGGSLSEVLRQIVLLIERQEEGMLCSILLLDKAQGRLHHGAAPSLPEPFVKAIDGCGIGPCAGSCGTAAHRREPVIVEDIGTHPCWVDYRHLALPHGLRACWSTPIFSGEGGEVLGTFAIYYRQPRAPSGRESGWVARATHLAALAIGRDRAQRALRMSDARYRQIVETTYEGVWLVDANARTLFVNDRAAQLLGYSPGEMLGRSFFRFVEDGRSLEERGRELLQLGTMRAQHEFHFKRKDGSSFWGLLAGSPIHDDDGQLVGGLGMLSDITELKQTEEALRRSEAEFRVVFENAAFGMALVDMDGRTLRANPALQQILGYSEAELRHRGLPLLPDPADTAPGDVDIIRLLTSGQRDSYQSEKRYRHKDGRMLWVRLIATLVRGPEDQPLYAIAMFEHVTERRQMEEAVRASEGLRVMMYGAVLDPLYYMAFEPPQTFRFLSVNPAFLRATGFTEEQVLGRRLEDVIPEPPRAAVAANYLKAIRERRTVTWEESAVLPAGIKYGEVSISPIFDQEGNCTNLVGSAHDITERRQAEERIRAQAALLDQARDAILVRGLDGVIQYWNKGAERLYGWRSDEVIGRSVHSVIYKDTRALEEAHALLAERGEWTGELVQHNKAGKALTVECRWTLLPSSEGRPASVLAINSDITERKVLEAQVFHSQRLESVGTLAGGIAHDFNNILAAMSGNVELALLSLNDTHPAVESLDHVQRAIDRATDLVRRLLTFSRHGEPARELMELEPVVTEALSLLRATLPPNVVTRTSFARDVPRIQADPVQIHQIIMNLCTNAAHAIGGRQGTISVALEAAQLPAGTLTATGELPAGRYARITVTDSGCGMDQQILQRAFDPFFTTKSPQGGTGLGLSVVHGIVKNHQGGIVVRSAAGAGSEFNIFLPAPRTASPPERPHSPGRRLSH